MSATVKVTPFELAARLMAANWVGELTRVSQRYLAYDAAAEFGIEVRRTTGSESTSDLDVDPVVQNLIRRARKIKAEVLADVDPRAE